ncbi:hypothetical protein ACQVP2_27295 [Methylobacterium aquaticum]|uniref:hypothetical protein n=1 Tax=Methylobacterium aquaticum TaxID=270351 RepID=UPI003D167526
MATNTNPTKPAVRALLHGQVGEIRTTFTFADVNRPMSAAFPAGAQITSTVITVTQAFNAGTTNPLTVGSTPGGSDLVAAIDSVAGTVGVKRPDTATALGRLAADTVPYISYAPTGTAPTQGSAEIVFLYVAPRA